MHLSSSVTRFISLYLTSFFCCCSSSGLRPRESFFVFFFFFCTYRKVRQMSIEWKTTSTATSDERNEFVLVLFLNENTIIGTRLRWQVVRRNNIDARSKNDNKEEILANKILTIEYKIICPPTCWLIKKELNLHQHHHSIDMRKIVEWQKLMSIQLDFFMTFVTLFLYQQSLVVYINLLFSSFFF